jgi:aspartyl-tRNA(Asn)/glutamyl-tRNA(Gln) amidotransferase subunit A
MADLIQLGLKEAAEKIKNREISSVELTEACLARIEVRQPEVNAFIRICADTALEMAAAADHRVKEGKGRLLEGVPLGIKDLFCTKGVPTTAASHMLEGFVPPYESTVTANLWRAGGVLLGKLNMDEFAMGTTNEHSYYGPVRNPWALDRIPGGSSGGSAAAVADYQCPAATGTDTGGSIRQPAAMCGVVGIRPTYGRCSRYGMVAFASSLDQAGAFGRNVTDAALLLRAMSGHDPKDSTSADVPMESFDEKLEACDVDHLRIGIPKEYMAAEGLDPRIRDIVKGAARKFEAQGAEIVEVSLPHTEYGPPAYYIIAPAEAASNLARYDGMRYGLRVEGENLVETYKKSRAAGFGREVKRRIMIGNYTLSSGYYDAYYSKAQRVRTLIAQDFQSVFEKVDVLLAPTTPTPAFKLGGITDPVQMYLQDMFTLQVNLAGLPGVSVPAGVVGEEGTNLPVGVQFIGKPFAEKDLLKVAYAFEQMAEVEQLEVQHAS